MPTASGERSAADRAALEDALAAVEQRAGEARAAARMKFLDARGVWLLPRASDVALLPRFEALLDSRDDDDVWLGVVLVGGVGHPSSLAKLWSVVNTPSRNPALRAKAISTIAASYRDPKAVALQEAAADEMTYSRWAEGISIDYPKDWRDEDLDGYSKVFRNQRTGAFYGYRVIPLKRPTKAAALRDEIGRREHLRNELAREAGRPAHPIWQKTGATDVAEGRYVVRRDGKELLRRAVFLVEGNRGVIVAGEAPKESAPEFEPVFDRMWPTIRIQAPDPESAAALTKAINEGLQRAAQGQLLPPAP